jgi:SAM-dependent methyltransferase
MNISGAKRQVQRVVNSALRPLNVQVIRARSDDPAVKKFLHAGATARAARKAGMSVAEYVDQTYSQPGTTQQTVDAMISIGDLKPADVKRVCEIGAGTGRYLELVSAALHPEQYEVYETADDWLPHLQRLPNVVIRDSDARTLGGTETSTVDLVHAQKVFVYTEFWTTASYLAEMARVVRPGGVVAFDIVTEGCLDDDVVSVWIRDSSIYHPVPKAWVIDYLGRRMLEYLGSHFNSMPPGQSELLVFRRNQDT